MEEPQQPQHNEKFQLLTEWSKWLITINFAAATGCTIVFQKAVENGAEKLIGPLQLAILFFAISIVIAVVLIFLISIGYLKTLNKSFWIAVAQLACFLLALVFFGIWIKIKACTKPKPEPARCVMCKTP
ncbi:hypothetical protein [Mucilaginibacter sp.]|jgi:amino acid permease|uniref:hypothetical protein n=1 Tax=Mucilaginibacter sp. TaxID=1882438 RepID=UPI0035697109